MLTVSQLSKSFAGRALFDDVSLQVNRAARDMDCKTLHTAHKRIRMDGKMIDMSPEKTDTDQKMTRLDRKTGNTSPSQIV